MRFLAVTTFNEAGRKLYGQRMMESYLANWPASVPLVAYAEGWQASAPAGIEVRDLLASSPWLGDFKARNKHRPTGQRGYVMDAVRFSHKVGALAHAVSLEQAEIVIWLDGDIFTHSPIHEENLQWLAPAESQWIAWLDRAHIHPECGFYMLNTRHPRHAEIFGAFENMYRKDELFRLKEWHDSYVLQQVVRLLGAPTKSLSGGFQRAGHPLVNGPLGSWLDHLKGDRKNTGRSRSADMLAIRQEAYWKGPSKP